MNANDNSSITPENEIHTAPYVPTESPVTQKHQARSSKSIWSIPLGSLINNLARNQDAIRRFLSLTGGSIFYCLSALSIVYGITQIIGPPLAESSNIGDILPCVGVLNVYELALLAVLILVVVWRNVTDDAISLVVLIALFLVASGGIAGVEDVERLQEAGIDGVIIGKALYEKKITLDVIERYIVKNS
jgi:hypothetical protein